MNALFIHFPFHANLMSQDYNVQFSKITHYDVICKFCLEKNII